MTLLMAGLKRSKTGAFVARKVIPKDLRSEYALLYGLRWEEKFYLPASVSEPEAKARYGEWLADVETKIARLRATKKGGGQPLTRENAYALAGRWYAWFITRPENDGRTPGHWQSVGDTLVWDIIRPHAPDEYEEHPTPDRLWDWRAAPEVREAIRPAIEVEAKTATFLLEQEIALTPDANRLFVDAVSDKLLPAFVRLEAMARGQFGFDGTLETCPAYDRIPSAARKLSVWSLFEKWVVAVQPANSTRDRWAAVFKVADVQFPDAVAIDFASAKSWMNSLLNDDRSAKTVATVWRTALKTVFGWGLLERLVENNPFPFVRIAVPRKNVERETKAFSREEVTTILSAALACDDSKSFDERTRRWVPWICAYSGARAGEITQLRASDISQRATDYFARLTPSAGKIKTRRARTIPIHEHLIAQGFIQFVARAEGMPLFYEPTTGKRGRKPKGTSRQSPAERARGRLGQWVRALGVSDPEISPNHAWRHTFKAQAARVGIDERSSDAITGHSPATTGRSYTNPLPEDLAKELRKFPRYELDDDSSTAAINQLTHRP